MEVKDSAPHIWRNKDCVRGKERKPSHLQRRHHPPRQPGFLKLLASILKRKKKWMCAVFLKSYHLFIHLKEKADCAATISLCLTTNLEAPPTFSVSRRPFRLFGHFVVFVREPCKQVIKQKAEMDYTHTVKQRTRLQWDRLPKLWKRGRFHFSCSRFSHISFSWKGRRS